MRVCIVSLKIVPFFRGDTNRIFGGSEAQDAFVARALQMAGNDVHMVVSDLPSGATFPFPVENAFMSESGIRGLRFFTPRWTGIMDALARTDADIYYQRNAGMITGLTAMFCKRNNKVFVYGAGSIVDFDPRRVAIKGLRDRMIFQYGLRHSHGLIVQNEEQAAAARSAFEKPIRIISNGVHPVETIPGDEPNRVVWVGALWAVKRPDILIDIARQVPERQFMLVGGNMTGHESLATTVNAEAAKLANVEMTGRLPNPEVQKVLKRALVLVNTSDVEGFPNAYLEAWSQGVPVITFTDVDGIIVENDVGIVCTTVDEMTKAVRCLSEDTRARNRMGENGRKLVADRFSAESLGTAYTDFFQMLITKNSNTKLEP